MNDAEGKGPDHAQVVAPPPLIYGPALLVIWGLDRIWPAAMTGGPLVVWVGGLFAVAGLALTLWGVQVMNRARTAVHPYHSSSRIVASGPFRFSRNPLYMGLNAVLVGVTFMLDSWWGFLVLVPVLLVMHYGVVLREERYLEGKFGDTYRAYREAVRRYF